MKKIIFGCWLLREKFSICPKNDGFVRRRGLQSPSALLARMPMVCCKFLYKLALNRSAFYSVQKTKQKNAKHASFLCMSTYKSLEFLVKVCRACITICRTLQLPVSTVPEETIGWKEQIFRDHGACGLQSRTWGQVGARGIHRMRRLQGSAELLLMTCRDRTQSCSF